jgi:hypothetical protein
MFSLASDRHYQTQQNYQTKLFHHLATHRTFEANNRHEIKTKTEEKRISDTQFILCPIFVPQTRMQLFYDLAKQVFNRII